ncbi:RDD family protein [Luteimonas deserti]|uniref:RDD family protein n=1 Tax=Luteimonas deserti TaxID=2752306 RepID=A0A7Z0QRE2_9GAMM|nr:RDD family protein [Luteimonas deserti]NYZ62118.1 RDD family protein [Luteimonas deserti]
MSSTPDTSSPPRAHAWIGRRLLALLYDLWPVLALWLLLSAVFTVGHTVVGRHDVHANIAPLSGLQWLLWLACWGITGLYAVVSWRHGGQTLGMRPWRLRVRTIDGRQASTSALWLRFAVGTVSLLSAGAGFWWAWIDRDRLTWHDRASGTRLVRVTAAAKGRSG